jgi:WD40 repeat protein
MSRLLLVLAALGAVHAQQQGFDAVPKDNAVKAIRGVAFSPDGKWLITGGIDKRLHSWNLSTGIAEHHLDDQRLECMALSPTSADIAAGLHNDLVGIYRVGRTGEIERADTLVAAGRNQYKITSLAWSRDGGHLYTANGTSNGAMKQWDVGQRKEIKVKNAGSATYNDLAVAPDEHAVIGSSARDRTFRIVGITPDGQANERHFTGGSFGTACIFLGGSLETGYFVLIGYRNGVLDIGQVQIATPPTKGAIQITRTLVDAHAGQVRRIVASPDETLWATADSTGQVWLWNAKAGTVIGRGHHRADVRSVAFSKDGKLLASGDEHGTVRVWQVQPFRLVATLVSFADGDTLSYLPDGRYAGDPAQIAMWYRDGNGPFAAPDGKRVATLSIPTPADSQTAVALNSKFAQTFPEPLNSKTSQSKNTPVPPSGESTPKEQPKSGPQATPPARDSGAPTPPGPERALVASRANLKEACANGVFPGRLTEADLRWRSDPEFDTAVKVCAASADATLRIARAEFERKHDFCSAPPAWDRDLVAAQFRFEILDFVKFSPPAPLDRAREIGYYIARRGLCQSTSFEDAARRFDAIQPPFKDSQARARQAYAKLALSRADAAAASDRLDEAEKQVAEFRRQNAAISDPAVAKEEASDFAHADALSRTVRGKRLYQAGVNAIKQGRLDDGRASLEEAKTLLDPKDPAAQNTASLLRQLSEQRDNKAAEDMNRQIEQHVAAALAAIEAGDLGTARTRAMAAIGLAPAGSVLTDRARKVLVDVEAAERAERRRTIIRASAGGGILLLIAVLFAAPMSRALLFSWANWSNGAARIYVDVLAADSGKRSAIIRLYQLRHLPFVSELLTEVFVAYLKGRPEDGRVVLLAGLWALERGKEEDAENLLGRALQLGVDDPALFHALLRMPRRTVEAGAENLRKIAAVPEQRDAAKVLARHYMSAGNIASDALEVYESVLSADPQDDELRLDTARAYLRAAQPDKAALHLETLLSQGSITREMLEAVADLAHHGSAGRGIELLRSPKVGALDRLRTAESIADADPSTRGQIDALYRDCPPGENFTIAALFRAHMAIGNGDSAAAVALVEACRWPCADDGADVLAQVRRLLRRMCPAAPGSIRLALARTECELGNYRAAFAELEALRSEKILAQEVHDEAHRVLGRMSLPEISLAFFRQAGWTVDESDELVAAPPADADPQVSQRFSGARICISAGELEAEDVVRLREDLPVGAAILVAPERPRRGVYALLYATLVECRELSLVPLDKGTMKTALADGGARDVLLQTLNLWLGRGDVFDERNPVSDTAAFFGRGPLIHQLVNKILNRQNFGLYGLRKMGKTSLMYQLREGLPLGMLLLYIDLQAVAGRTCTELCCQIADELRRQLETKYPGAAAEVQTPVYSRNLTLQDALTSMDADLSTALRLIGNNRAEVRILLVLDEIERMIPHGVHRGFDGLQDFFRLIRGVYQQRRQVVSAVVGADPTLCRLGKWGDVDNPVFQYYDEIFLAPLDRADCDAMVQGLGAILGVEFPPESLGRIYEETAGHPFVTRQLCSRIVQRYPERPLRVIGAMVEAGVAEYLELRYEYLREIYEHYLSEDAQTVLEGIAIRRSAWLDRPAMDEILAESVETPGGRVRALQELELFHLVVRRDGRFEVPMGILMRYLRSDWESPDLKKRIEHA